MDNSSIHHGKKKRIGELLMERGYITSDQVEHALAVQGKKYDRICNILIDLGYLTEQDFLDFLGTMPGTASIELSACIIDKAIIDLVPAELARRLELVPIGKIGNVLTVGMVCPIDELGRRELEEVTGLKIRAVLCSRGALLKSYERYYNKSEQAVGIDEPEGDIADLESPLKLKRIAKLVEEIEELPTLPDILNRVASIINDPDSSVVELARVIATDVALAGKILKLANSPAYGFSRKISDIQQAVTLLGLRETQSLALSVAVYDQLVDTTALDFKAFWNHSLACATLAKLISLAQKAGGKEVAFTAGLLHDIGQVMLAMKMKVSHEEAAKLYSAVGTQRIEAEHQNFGIDHAEVGYLLAEHWLLPTQVSNAIRYHHSPELEPDPKELSSTVFLANAFCALEPSQLGKPLEFDDKVYKALNTAGIPETAFRRALSVYSKMASEISRT